MTSSYATQHSPGASSTILPVMPLYGEGGTWFSVFFILLLLLFLVTSTSTWSLSTSSELFLHSTSPPVPLIKPIIASPLTYQFWTSFSLILPILLSHLFYYLHSNNVLTLSSPLIPWLYHIFHYPSPSSFINTIVLASIPTPYAFFPTTMEDMPMFHCGLNLVLSPLLLLSSFSCALSVFPSLRDSSHQHMNMF